VCCKESESEERLRRQVDEIVYFIIIIILFMCCKESESEERLRRQVDEMQLTVTLSDVEPDANELTEQIAALRSEVHNLTHSPFHY